VRSSIASALLDVDLEEISEVVERRAGLAEPALLLDRRRLRVALRDDDAAQGVAELARHLLVGGRSVVVAEADARVRVGRLQEDAPAVLRHLDVVEVRPPVGGHVNGGAEPDLLVLKPLRPHLAPPVKVVRQPLLQSPLEALVAREVDVVRYPLVKLHRFPRRVFSF
jgi:hypothetical protein